MRDAREHLETARAALLGGRTDECARALASFETLLEDAVLDQAQAAVLQQKLAHLGNLTRAALAGIADARAQVSGAVHEASRLSTYSNAGKREERLPPRPSMRSF